MAISTISPWAVYGAWVFLILAAISGCDGTPDSPRTTVGGRIVEVNRVGTDIRAKLDTDDGVVTLAISPGTTISDTEGERIAYDKLYPGFVVEASGAYVDAAAELLIAERMTVLDSPSIIIAEPSEGEVVRQVPLVIRGYARLVEEVVEYRITAPMRPTFIAKGRAIARSPDIGKYGTFEVLFSPKGAALDTGLLRIEAFGLNSRDGSPIDIAVRTVQLALPRVVALYFPNSCYDTARYDCAQVFTTQRPAVRSSDLADVLQLLIQGPTSEEKTRGFFTSIPLTTRLNSVRLADGHVYADFSFPRLGGSCVVTALRAQIEETVKANTPAREVTILQDGITEEALQP